MPETTGFKKGTLFRLGGTVGCNKPTARMEYLVADGFIRMHDGENTQVVRENIRRPYLLLCEIKGCSPVAGLMFSFENETEREDKISLLEKSGGCYWVGDLNQTVPECDDEPMENRYEELNSSQRAKADIYINALASGGEGGMDEEPPDEFNRESLVRDSMS